MTPSRLEIVRQLLDLSVPLDSAASALRRFGWDYEGEQAELRRKHLKNVLNLYLDERLPAADVERWANLVEGREDICFEEGAEEAIGEILYQLANPVLVGRLTKESAEELIAAASQ